MHYEPPSANSLLPRGEVREILGFFNASRLTVTALNIYYESFIMRAREFLIEYNRQITQQNYGDKIVMIARRDPTIPQLVRKEADNAQLADIVLSQLEKADPTKNKEYTQGLAKMYANGGLKMEDATSTLTDYLIKFHKLKVKQLIPSPHNDFLRYANVSDFMNVVDKYELPDDKNSAVERGHAQVVYEDANVRIIKPQDQAAACYYGQGTRWCTAATKGTNWFDRYNDKGPLYILLPKKPVRPGEKYQFHFSGGQFKDEHDDNVDMMDIIKRRFGDLTPIFLKLEPELQNYVQFTDPAVLEDVCEKIKEVTMEYLWDLGEKFSGRFFDEGIQIINRLLESASGRINEYLKYWKEWDEEDNQPTVGDLANIIASAIKSHARRDDHVLGGVADWMKKQIRIHRSDHGEWMVDVLPIQRNWGVRSPRR